MDVFFEGIETYMGIINVYKSTICKKKIISFSPNLYVNLQIRFFFCTFVA